MEACTCLCIIVEVTTQCGNYQDTFLVRTLPVAPRSVCMSPVSHVMQCLVCVLVGVSLSNLELDKDQWTELGSMLFLRRVSGIRLVLYVHAHVRSTAAGRMV